MSSASSSSSSSASVGSVNAEQKLVRPRIKLSRDIKKEKKELVENLIRTGNLTSLQEMKDLDHNGLLYTASKYRQLLILEWLCKQIPTPNYNWILYGASNAGDLKTMQFATSHGADNLEGAIEQCTDIECLNWLYELYSIQPKEPLLPHDDEDLCGEDNNPWQKLASSALFQGNAKCLQWMLDRKVNFKIDSCFGDLQLEQAFIKSGTRTAPVDLKTVRPKQLECIKLLYSHDHKTNLCSEHDQNTILCSEHEQNTILWMTLGFAMEYNDVEYFRSLLDNKDNRISVGIDLVELFEIALGDACNLECAKIIYNYIEDKTMFYQRPNVIHSIARERKLYRQEDIKYFADGTRKSWREVLDPDIEAKIKNELTMELGAKHIFSYVSHRSTPECLSWLREQKEFKTGFDPEVTLERASYNSNLALMRYAKDNGAIKFAEAFENVSNCCNMHCIEFADTESKRLGLHPNYIKVWNEQIETIGKPIWIDRSFKVIQYLRTQIDSCEQKDNPELKVISFKTFLFAVAYDEINYLEWLDLYKQIDWQGLLSEISALKPNLPNVEFGELALEWLQKRIEIQNST